MYKVVTKEDTIRIPAEYMRKGQSLDQHIDRLSMDAFEGKFDSENRFVLVTNNHKTLGRGRIIHGDGAIYQRVQFDAVLFCMDDQEVVEGAVSEVNEFGAFVRIGPMEALLHKSQIMDEPVDINIGANKITGRQTGRELSIGSFVRARIVSLSPDTSDPRRSKIGLTSKMVSAHLSGRRGVSEHGQDAIFLWRVPPRTQRRCGPMPPLPLSPSLIRLDRVRHHRESRRLRNCQAFAGR